MGKAMIDCDHVPLVTQQDRLVGFRRSSGGCQPRAISEAALKSMRQFNKLHLEHPFAGAQMLLWRLCLESTH